MSIKYLLCTKSSFESNANPGEVYRQVLDNNNGFIEVDQPGWNWTISEPRDNFLAVDNWEDAHLHIVKIFQHQLIEARKIFQ